MSNWTSRHSVLMSKLLDDVIGTREIIAIRHDYLRHNKYISSVNFGQISYLIGSQSEGLELPKSIKDEIQDINVRENLEVIQQGQAVPWSHREQIFEIVTDNVHPGFAMLRSKTTVTRPLIVTSMQVVNGSHFLSSYLMLYNSLLADKHPNVTIQGPAIRHPVSEDYATETNVYNAIHCPFWPSVASEWIYRTRPNGWPQTDVIDKIVEFGFHLVPSGYSRSPMKNIEWKIYFSIAEKHLIRSFNQVQIQMYALLKIILKEYITKNCCAENNVLSSYILKTFLFWKFEETEKDFWKIENFRGCFQYLLTDLRKQLHDGILKHYFIPSYNLLEEKLTQIARLELLQLCDDIIQYDIRIIEKCITLKQMWVEFLDKTNNKEISACCGVKCYFLNCNLSKRSLVKNTICMIVNVKKVDALLMKQDTDERIVTLEALKKYPDTKSNTLEYYIAKRYCFMNSIPQNTEWPTSNKSLYNLLGLFNNLPIDIATGKLWTAILFLMKTDYNRALCIINKLLSSISPYALYISCNNVMSKNETMFADMFLNSELNFSQIGRRACLLNFCAHKENMSILPAAIQMELIHSSIHAVEISPFTCVYYLQFLCYHGLRQFDNRDRALRQLVDVPKDPEQCGCPCIRYHAYNIAGHCLLFVGENARARGMFLKSCGLELEGLRSTGRENNSARYYLRNYL